MDPRITDIVNEIIEVCDRHGVVLGHEDSHGGFLFRKKEDMKPEYVEIYHKWLRGADWKQHVGRH